MLIIILTFLINLNCWEQYTPDNSILFDPFISKIFTDSKGYTWIGGRNSNMLVRYKDGKFEDFTNKRASYDNLYIYDIDEDEYGNIIFLTKKTITVFDGKSWYYTPEVLFDNFLEWVGNLVYLKDRLYFNVLKPGAIYYFEYDLNKKKYDFERGIKEFIQLEGINDENIGKYVIKNDSIISMFGIIRYIDYNIYTNKWEFLKDENGKDFNKKYFPASNFAEYLNNNYYISHIYDSISVLKNHFNNFYKFEKIYVNNEFGNGSSISDIEYLIEEDLIFVAKTSYLLVINKDNNVFEISTPKGLKLAKGYDKWDLLFIHLDENFFWIGTINHGLIRFDKQEILNYLSVEKSLIDNLNFLNLYPNPLENTTLNIEFYDITRSENYTINLFDIRGIKLENPKIISNYKVKDINKMALELKHNQNGMYFLSIENKTDKKFYPLIINQK